MTKDLEDVFGRLRERLETIGDFPVPSDDELIAMQKRGELPSDEDLAREDTKPGS